jgi:hypothetical protein
MATNEVFCGDDKPFRFAVPDDLAVELEGAAFYCSVQTSGGSKISAAETTVDVANRVCWAWFSKAQTAAMVPPKQYSGDGLLVLADGDNHTIGTISFRAVARTTPNP